MNAGARTAERDTRGDEANRTHRTGFLDTKAVQMKASDKHLGERKGADARRERECRDGLVVIDPCKRGDQTNSGQHDKRTKDEES